jgi:hypothetical protein
VGRGLATFVPVLATTFGSHHRRACGGRGKPRETEFRLHHSRQHARGYLAYLPKVRNLLGSQGLTFETAYELANSYRGTPPADLKARLDALNVCVEDACGLQRTAGRSTTLLFKTKRTLRLELRNHARTLKHEPNASLYKARHRRVDERFAGGA